MWPTGRRTEVRVSEGGLATEVHAPSGSRVLGMSWVAVLETPLREEQFPGNRPTPSASDMENLLEESGRSVLSLGGCGRRNHLNGRVRSWLVRNFVRRVMNLLERRRPRNDRAMASASRRLPAAGDPTRAARGSQIVEAVADHWEVTPARAGGKTVAFPISMASEPSDRRTSREVTASTERS